MRRLPALIAILALTHAVRAGEIHTAVRAADEARVKALLTANPSLAGTQSETGESPLHIAVANDADEIARLLLTMSNCAYTDRFIDADTAEGRAALKSGALAKARDLLTRLLKQDPANEKINFAYGIASLSLADYPRAGLAFERVIGMNPGNQRARVELAHTHLAAGHAELAGNELRSILEEGDLPEPVRRRIEENLKQITAATRRWRLAGRVDVGAFYDSNVNVGPDSDVVSIEPLIFGSQVFIALDLDKDSQPAEAGGLFGYAALSGAYDPGRPGEWDATVNGIYYQNWVEGEREHESLYAEVSAGPRHRHERGVLELPLSVAHIASGLDALVNLYGANPSYLSVRGGGEWHWLTAATLEYRDYADLDDRDGLYLSAGETIRRFLGAAGHNVQLGVKVFYDFADAGVFEHFGIAGKLGGEVVLPGKSVLYSRLRYTWTDYDEREVLAPATRSDNQFQVIAGVSKKLASRWGLDVNYMYTDNESSFDLYEYDRHVATVSTSCRF